MAMARSARLLSKAAASGALSVCRRQVAASNQARSLPLFSLLSCDGQAPGVHLFLRRYSGAPLTREELEKLLETERARAENKLKEVIAAAGKQVEAERARAEKAEKLVKELLENKSSTDEDEAMHGMHVQRELRLASSCFGQPYKGTGSEMLKQILDKRVKEFEDSLSTLPNKSNKSKNSNESQQRFYAKYVALTNSSAMGKSRTVLQLGHDHNVFVFYCSCALPTATTFPPRTPRLAARLEAAVTTHEMTLYMVSWLQVLVSFLAKQSHIQNAAKCWVELQERSFYNPEEAGVVEQVFDVWQKLCGEYTGSKGMPSEETELQKRLETKITEVLEVLKHETSELKLLFVVDEAEALLVEKERTTYPPFIYLRRAAQVLGKSTLLLSISMSYLAPAGEDNESRRARQTYRGLLHPVCNSSGLDLMVQDGEVAPAAVRTWLENPLRWTLYGRPLWGLRYGCEGDIKKLLELAQLKLLKVSKFVDDTARRLPPETTVSLLAFTVGTEIVPCHPLAREVSSGHMTAMAIISKDRKSFWTVAPLEPVLSAAAASLLQDPDVLERALVHQLDFVRRGYTMPRDDRLETVLKTIVMVAMLECQEPLIRRGEFLSCVPTTDFLRVLLGPNCHLPPSLNNSYVFFNRILRIDHIPSPLEVMEYYKRGVICAGAAENNNLGVDLYIFVWFPHAKKQNRGKCELKNGGKGEGEQSEGFSADHFSQILVTTKLEEGQAARKLTSFVGVPEGLPIIGIDYQVGSVPSLGKVKAPCEGDQHVYSLTGIPMALSAGRYKACMEQLTKLVELDAVLCADQEPQECFSNVDPWTRLELLPKKFKETVRKKKEKTNSQTARTRLK